MGASTDPEVDGASSSGTYQLVRVEGDGRLVPATNAEVMEVEPLLEDDKSELPSNEADRHPLGCDREGFFSKTSYLVGLLNSETARLDSRKLDAESKNFINMENAKSDIETSNSLEVDLGQPKLEDSSDNHHNNSLDTVSSFKGCPRRKHHRAWTLSEVTKLVDGVAMFGAGRWSEIKRLSFASYSYRTSVDLKDKWRNLLRASFAQSSIHQSGRNLGNNTSVPLPRSVLSRVRELAEIHSQSGIEFRPARYPSDIGRTTQEQSGFL